MILEVDGLTHRYGGEPAVEDVSFGLAEGELVALLGPSGCGKTTLVHAIAGHVQPTAGRVRLRDRDVTAAPPETLDVGLVFQQSTLFPHMTVGENVAYGLESRDLSPDRVAQRVERYLELVSLSANRDAYPSELSGGQRRRVELARALAPEPDVLLLDEPLSALDRNLRERLRREIARIQDETGVTTLYVTHDQQEAMALADRLLVMDDGSVAGSGPPRALYESPPSRFVASFLGRSNTFAATVVADHPLTVSVGGQELALPDTECQPGAGAAVTCHVRPADIAVRSADPAESTGPALSLTGEVVDVADLGRRYDVTVATGTGDELVVETSGTAPTVGADLAVEIPHSRISILGTAEDEPERSNSSNRVRESI